jgi:uncharacterized membrane protein YbjE (DUF340 family)
VCDGELSAEQKVSGVMMIYFAVFVVPLVAGIVAGYALREKWQANLNKATLPIIIALVFSLGFSIGIDNDALSSLPRVGWNALFIASLTIVFSIVLVELARRKVKLA